MVFANTADSNPRQPHDVNEALERRRGHSETVRACRFGGVIVNLALLDTASQARQSTRSSRPARLVETKMIDRDGVDRMVENVIGGASTPRAETVSLARCLPAISASTSPLRSQWGSCSDPARYRLSATGL